MKKIIFLIGIFGIVLQSINAQSSDCSSATPFCTGTSISFPASTSTLSPVGPYYGCLGSQPNPAFFQLQIGQPGNITITLQSTPLVDIDFICWGPFTDPTTMCDNLTEILLLLFQQALHQ